MKYNIRGDKLVVTDSIKEYIESKLEKLNKYFKSPEEITANVLLRIRGHEQIVEVTIYYEKIILRAEVSREDLYASIDLVSDKIERQIRKNKTRMKKQNNNEKYFNMEFDYESTDEESTSKIVKRKFIETKPMHEEEAVLEMELIGHDFFVFRNIDNNMAIVYKRKDGDIGIIETK